MMVAVPSVEAPRTSDGLGESSTLSGGDTPLACSDQPSDLGSIPSWSSSTSKGGSDGSKRLAVRGIVGEGGSGKVFLVRDVMQEQDVAMKVVRVTDSSLPLEYRGVVTEVKILRMLSEAPQKFLLEPYMGCTRRDWLTPFGDLHILTKYYAGGTLEQYLGLLSHREVWLVTAELVLGLNWLHTQGLVHHDLKPANVLVGSDGHCAIADFNSCRQLKDGKLRRRFVFDEVVFTQNYAAPELLPDSNGVEPEYDQSVDIWSLGVVVSELLTGELFGGVNSCTKANVGGSRDDALSHMADAEGACSYLVDLVRGMLSEDPIERMDIAGISKCPGFDQHMWVVVAASVLCRLADTGAGASSGKTSCRNVNELSGPSFLSTPRGYPPTPRMLRLPKGPGVMNGVDSERSVASRMCISRTSTTSASDDMVHMA
ncbi:kinase-like domain-containing protein [Fomitopsis serialis]|uniref:kinase-like domain-containing protein n=1 Tax=Fomitopsis serialis TaxID=139415 RepID=UPI002007CF75|nr:kinase-like domain-containing protein [Neoantrodia serialis]KAH9931446.1 kinase-like domain-containing protein [Neoantrodia serialis]